VIANRALGETPVDVKVQHAPCPCLELFVARAADVEIFTPFNGDKVFALLNIHQLILSHLQRSHEVDRVVSGGSEIACN